ncbi:hypothetical protein I4U23_015926 [Adineta vaga]|nr:hypothetical protein I4U23_015926 [Adineta vaga]
MSKVVSVNTSRPRDAIIDSNNYLVTVEQRTDYLVRFDSTNLTRIFRQSRANSNQLAITFFNNAYYIASDDGESITVIDSRNLTILSIIPTSGCGIRGIIFLNQGQTMIGTAYDDNSLVFLNRTSLVPIVYKISFLKRTSFPDPHGIWRVNDSFFYVTSNINNALYSFQTTNSGRSWNETFVLQMPSKDDVGYSSRVTIDECNRFWFAFERDTILIYDQDGAKLGSWILPNSTVFDIKIMDNYLMYITESNTNRIRRFQPDIQC